MGGYGHDMMVVASETVTGRGGRGTTPRGHRRQQLGRTGGRIITTELSPASYV